MPVQPYILPKSSETPPGGLTVTQFIQAVLVGISGLPGEMVRPKWQIKPPKNPPAVTENWLAFGIDLTTPDNNAYLGSRDGGLTIDSQRQEAMDVSVSIYGPDALEIYGVIRDGIQIPQNQQALATAEMVFVEILAARRIPDLVNEQFYNRVETGIILRRQVNRIYAVPTILSATGVIQTMLGSEEYSLDWEVENEET